MIRAQGLDLQFGEQIIYNSIKFLAEQHDKIGLVGRNGTGKSTLLKIIAKQMQPDAGTIEIPKSFRVAYMAQEVVITSSCNVYEETLKAFSHLAAFAKEKEELNELLHTTANPSHEQVERYAELEHILLEQNFAEKKVQVKKILAGLGFDEQKQNLRVDQLSVGWRMRIVLAKLLLQDADFYLFDEPTNHLDLPTKNWFLNFLKNSSFGYILVCHDRYFLDQACNKTFELSQGKLNIYHGNYSYFINQKSVVTEQLEQAYKKQQQEIKQKERTIERFRSKSSKAKMAQSMIKSLEKVDRIELEEKQKNIIIKLDPPKPSGRTVLTVKNVAHAFDHQLFKNVSFIIERGDNVALIAPNGTGKTTLFNLIAQKLPLQHGSIELGHNVITSLFDQDQEKVLDPNKTILQEVSDACGHVSERRIRSVLGSFLFSQDDTDKKTSVLSGGERNRVAMAKVILSKANFLLLDEPTNHLDIESKEIILQALKKFEGTILFVSHDQDFVNKLATKIIALDTHAASMYFGNYDDYLAAKTSRETHAVTTINKQTKPASGNNNKATFALQKKSKNLEKKITKNEDKMHSIAEKLGAVLYGTDEYHKLEHEYKNLQEQVTIDTREWENILTELDKENE